MRTNNDEVIGSFKSKILTESKSLIQPKATSLYTLDKSGNLSTLGGTSLDEALDALSSKVVIITTEDLKSLYEAKKYIKEEVSDDPQESKMEQAQLTTICENVKFLQMQVMKGHNWPAWAFEHLTVACDNIQEITQFFKSEPDPNEEEGMYTDEPNSQEFIGVVGENKKKPSAGLSKKEKSTIVKKAEKGEDLGKKGKGFTKVEKSAEKEYGNKETAKKVAGSVFWRQQSKGKK